MKITKLVFCTCLLFAVQSCVGTKNIPKNYTPKKGEGVAIFSITASGECGISFFGELKNIESGEKYSINLSNASENLDWLINANSCTVKRDSYYGRLAVLSLPAGIYTLYQFEGINDNKKMYLNRDMDIKFTVVEGVNNYLGNLHFQIDGRNLYFDLKNKAKRDLAVFKQKYYKLSKVKTVMYE